jgi:chemotaxis methyl-accepting protein methylase
VKKREPESECRADTLIRLLQEAHGLDLSPFDAAFLDKSAEARREEGGFASVAALTEHLTQHRAAAEAFCRSLRIGYSEFFRSPLAFAVLEKLVLPGLVAEKGACGRGEIRVWSAGCAAGQEAWSVAMLLECAVRAGEQPTSYRIFATDQSDVDLTLASAGVYGSEAVGNVRLRHLDAFFSRQGESYAVAPRLRERVDFSAYDLLDERSASPASSIYGDFDLILCCNLLFYYRPGIRQRMLDKFFRALSPGGYFVTGEAERGAVSRQKGFRPVAPPSSVFQKRGKQ